MSDTNRGQEYQKDLLTASESMRRPQFYFGIEILKYTLTNIKRIGPLRSLSPNLQIHEQSSIINHQ